MRVAAAIAQLEAAAAREVRRRWTLCRWSGGLDGGAGGGCMEEEEASLHEEAAMAALAQRLGWEPDTQSTPGQTADDGYESSDFEIEVTATQRQAIDADKTKSIILLLSEGAVQGGKSDNQTRNNNASLIANAVFNVKSRPNVPPTHGSDGKWRFTAARFGAFDPDAPGGTCDRHPTHDPNYTKGDCDIPLPQRSSEHFFEVIDANKGGFAGVLWLHGGRALLGLPLQGARREGHAVQLRRVDRPDGPGRGWQAATGG